MTTVTLTMPRLGETMEEGTVSGWLVAEGTEFERGAALIEFETDKTAVEYPALGAGRLVKQLVSKGDLIRLGEPIAEIDLMGGDDWVSSGDATMDTTGSDEGSANEGQGDPVIIDLLMPRLGETMEEGRIMGWMVAIGERYERGVSILEVETDKTVAEFPALFPGRIVETLVEPGEMVKVDMPIARIEVARADAPQAGEAGEPKTSVPETQAVNRQPAVAAQARPGGPVRATPLARRAARRSGLDIASVSGTGRRGRIELADVERALAGREGTLAYESWGPASGAPVLLVHGFGGDRLTFDQLGKALGRAGLSVHAVDLPSHGKTEVQARNFEDIVTALAGELDPQRPVHLVGHSLGAAACVAAAARHGGAASLTLIAPAGLGLGIDAEFISGMARAESAGAVGHLLRRLSSRAETFSREIVAEIHAELAKGRLADLARDICRGGQQAINVRTDLTQLAGEIPVRALVGMQDRIVDWRDAIDVSPAIAVHVFPRAGHMPHWDAPAEVATILEKELHHV
ncbi:MAG: acetoin dehydrogenase dihydrolipoyllysine-residue acetyltransferase subunit [Rhizobiaceae bacterium]|nr:acetoin dehydrogenase dihydrolipoyllysine-residue acetyltransferase subunit [Rhizobiaceae bacterium]